MNALDVIALLLLIVTFVAGIRSGFFPQLGGLLGAAAGGIVALQLLPLVRPQLDGLDPSIRALVVLVGLVILIAIGETIGSAGGLRDPLAARQGRPRRHGFGRRRVPRPRPGTARHLAGRRPARGGTAAESRGAGAAIGGRSGAERDPALAHDDRRRAGPLAGCVGPAGSLRRPRADPRAARRACRRTRSCAPSPRRPSRARSRWTARPAPTRSRAAGSSSRTATS